MSSDYGHASGRIEEDFSIWDLPVNIESKTNCILSGHSENSTCASFNIQSNVSVSYSLQSSTKHLKYSKDVQMFEDIPVSRDMSLEDVINGKELIDPDYIQQETEEFSSDLLSQSTECGRLEIRNSLLDKNIRKNRKREKEANSNRTKWNYHKAKHASGHKIYKIELQKMKAVGNARVLIERYSGMGEKSGTYQCSKIRNDRNFCCCA